MLLSKCSAFVLCISDHGISTEINKGL